MPNVGATPPPLRSGRDIARGKKAACMGRASAAIIEKWVVEEGGGRKRAAASAEEKGSSDKEMMVGAEKGKKRS